MDSLRGPGALRWSCHGARERPWAALCAVAAIGAMAALVWVAAGDWMWGALAAIGLSASIIRFLLPTHCTVDASGVAVQHPLGTRSAAWAEITRVEWHAWGAAITTRSGRSHRTPLALPCTSLCDGEVRDIRAAIDTNMRGHAA